MSVGDGFTVICLVGGAALLFLGLVKWQNR